MKWREIKTENDMPPANVMVALLCSDYAGDYKTTGKWVPYKQGKGWWAGRFCDDEGTKIFGLKEIDQWALREES